MNFTRLGTSALDLSWGDPQWVGQQTATTKAYARSALETLLNLPLKWGVRSCSNTNVCTAYSSRNITKLVVAAPAGLGWATPITQEVLNSIGYPNSTHLLNKSIKQIINSNVSGRTSPPDSPTPKMCNECHFAGASKNYKPDTDTTTNPSIDPGESITRTTAPSTVYYTWNQAATNGIIDYFCARVGLQTDGKPGDLCEIFKKWRAGNYLP